MKLYNLFEEVILEEIERNRTLLTEGVSFDDVKAAIDGKYNVNILYRDYEDQPPSKRYIQVYNLAKTKSGTDAIRAYQIFGACHWWNSTFSLTLAKIVYPNEMWKIKKGVYHTTVVNSNETLVFDILYFNENEETKGGSLALCESSKYE